MAKIKVLIAASEDIIVAGLSAILTSDKSTGVCGIARSAAEICPIAEKSKPAVILYSMSQDDASLQEILDNLRRQPHTPIVIAMGYGPEITQVNQALRAGCSGYLLYSAGREDLLESIQRVVSGEQMFSEDIMKLMTEKYSHLAGGSTGEPDSSPITRREREVLQLVIDGYTSQEIAKHLYISPRTVETHRANLLSKLELKNTASLIRYALKEKKL